MPCFFRYVRRLLETGLGTGYRSWTTSAKPLCSSEIHIIERNGYWANLFFIHYRTCFQAYREISEFSQFNVITFTQIIRNFLLERYHDTSQIPFRKRRSFRYLAKQLFAVYRPFRYNSGYKGWISPSPFSFGFLRES